jgi:hypothetical protein
MLMAGLCFNETTSVFDQSALRHDPIGDEFLRPSVHVLGHIDLRFAHEVLFNQLIKLQAADGRKRLTWLDSISKLHVNLFCLPFNPGHNLGNLIEIERNFAWSRYDIWNHVCCDHVGPYSFLHGRRGLNGTDARSA